jgi:quinol monooxygenase YgiN
MLTPTRAESGCESYELYESDSRGRFYLNETWESQAALDRHLATPHFKRLEQTGRELVRESFEVNIVKEILTSAAAA